MTAAQVLTSGHGLLRNPEQAVALSERQNLPDIGCQVPPSRRRQAGEQRWEAQTRKYICLEEHSALEAANPVTRNGQPHKEGRPARSRGPRRGSSKMCMATPESSKGARVQQPHRYHSTSNSKGMQVPDVLLVLP